MGYNYLWVFIPDDEAIRTFPLFWSYKMAPCYRYEDLKPQQREVVSHLLSDNPEGLDPTKGTIISWGPMKFIETDDEIYNKIST